MYSNKLAVAVKASGKVLREFNKDTVYVPFGAEYTILIKNLNSVRAQVKVSIDGTDATEGTWLVVPANGEIELERFIKSGNLNKGNRFKFIERTSKIESGPRGIKVEDGLVRIEYQFEKVYTPAPVYHFLPTKRERWVKEEYYDWPQQYFGSVCGTAGVAFNGDPTGKLSGGGSLSSSTFLNAVAHAGNAADEGVAMKGLLRSRSIGGSPTITASCAGVNSASSTVFMSANACSAAMADGLLSNTVATFDSPKEELNENGITVAGSESDQKFQTVGWFNVETEKHVMVVKLLGETEAGKPVVKAVTVKAKPTCTTCGHVNKAINKFCSECGTSLNIL